MTIRATSRDVHRAWLLALALTITTPATAAERTISGVAHVVDGDTVIVSGEKIRLNGVDAPETDQLCLNSDGKAWTCGVEARDRLSAGTKGRLWSCLTSGRDKYERWLADCTVDGVDVSSWMVLNGWALSFTRYSHRYDRDEVLARAAQKGVWAGAFIAPWDWRSRNRNTVVLGALEVPVDAQKVLLLPGSEQTPPRRDCVIKGNLNREGACNFHVPDGRFYGRTQIDESGGERWFCSSDEAEAAGCRRSRQ